MKGLVVRQLVGPPCVFEKHIFLKRNRTHLFVQKYLPLELLNPATSLY